MPPSVARPDWRARPPRLSRNAARPRRRRRPQPNWRVKRKRPPPGSWRSKPNARRRATRATPPAKSENKRRRLWDAVALRQQHRPGRWGEPVNAEARCLVLLRRVVFLHAILLHAIILLHGVLGHRVLLHRVLGHGVFLHAVVLSHLVLGEGGRCQRQAERKSGNRYAQCNAGANGHGLVFL